MGKISRQFREEEAVRGPEGIPGEVVGSSRRK